MRLRKGYYHARPRTEEAPSPQRIDPQEAPQEQAKTRKRTSFDSFQKKWDKFDREVPDMSDMSCLRLGVTCFLAVR